MRPLLLKMKGLTRFVEPIEINFEDLPEGIVAIKGPVPGPNGSAVFITKEASPATA